MLLKQMLSRELEQPENLLESSSVIFPLLKKALLMSFYRIPGINYIVMQQA